MKQPTGLKAVGMVQIPETHFWQVWISTTGESIRCVAAVKESSKANDLVVLIQQEAQQGGLRDPQTVTALFGFLNRQSEGPISPLPMQIEREILQELAADKTQPTPHQSQMERRDNW
jgi:hypothetical protein